MSDYHMNESARGKGTAISRSAIQGLAIIALAMVLTACMAPRPGADLPPYGDSVRHTKAIQTYEPGDEVPSLHGAKAAEAMRVYRLPAAGGGQAPSAEQ
ncbi:hypothetical protein HOP62_06660 [Halomonas sp. MCCC 1A17488]|uniref:Uncharacterized protein n=1 Tax=Billgrantia sulfidoxydans TaxID=2733484 RepID=A0ABX7W245_9GAMM|nr:MULTISPECIES: hypothetical protein [Halomonas]MCE8015761.1 hypothetical protein [Halomonas sp. MCCC 1A17488]MCG3239094.1 hypothetical protein [Halomonas sp. MCCC 1A17488]QPP50961.1 hypothetical protein I4484_07735 [Halomonas sp. SS10-MC5]QTP54474.1 hypothetical protein HNO51_07145 [Halomonas sulfidoxydans]